MFVYFIMIIIGWVSVDIYYSVIYTKYARYARIYKRSYRDIYKPEKVRQSILSDFERNAAPTSKKIYWDKEDIYQIRKTLRKFRRSKQEQDPGMKEIYGVFWFDVKDISWGMEEQKVKLMPPFPHSKQKSKYVRMRRELLDIVEVVEEKEEEIENETGDGKQ